MKTTATLLLLSAMLVSCDERRLNFDRGIIPPLPVNFAAVNSLYDDYNSDLEITWNRKYFSLIFSTNRNSGGQNFDLTGYEGQIEADLVTGAFEMQAGSMNYSIVSTINSSNNEMGPYFTHDLQYGGLWKKGAGTRRFFYSTDINGNSDIYLCYYTPGDHDFITAGDPVPLTVLNTGSGEGYLTIHDNEVDKRETVYFMSDRDGNYDIFRARSDPDIPIDETPAVIIDKAGQLNSDADDKCPYICRDMIVFTSDREGGYGGFDLYYSLYNGQEWSVPVNFGSNINTEYDEYRPIVVSTEEEGFLNDLLIFSSDRPGGKGRFDLYYAGINRH